MREYHKRERRQKDPSIKMSSVFFNPTMEGDFEERVAYESPFDATREIELTLLQPRVEFY
jgi:hypothetical protein